MKVPLRLFLQWKDEERNDIGPVMATWTVLGNTGTITQISGTSTIFVGISEGTCILQATSNGLTKGVEIIIRRRPTIDVTPSLGTQGTPVTVWGEGFSGSEGITISFGTTPVIIQGGSNYSGTFSITFIVDEQEEGEILIKATEWPSQFTATATFTYFISEITGQAIFDLPQIDKHAGIVVIVKGTESQQWEAITDIMGYFTILGVPPGDYGTIATRVPGASPRVWKNIRVDAGNMTILPQLILLNGDADGNFEVNGNDFTLLKAAFFRKVGEDGYNPSVDFNDDCRIDTTDFGYLRTNYGCTTSPEYQP